VPLVGECPTRQAALWPALAGRHRDAGGREGDEKSVPTLLLMKLFFAFCAVAWAFWVLAWLSLPLAEL